MCKNFFSFSFSSQRYFLERYESLIEFIEKQQIHIYFF